MITGAEAIVKSLELENVNIIFGYPGATILPFYDALLSSSIKHVLTRHEQGAAHAASGFARASGKTGVCIATSGPGATNLITGIATAYMDSIPMIAITGQVSTDQIGRDVFQEADITGATAPFCKHSYLVKDAKELPRIIKEAFYIASTGRPGPVVIDIPVDVQNSKLDFKYPVKADIRGYKPTLNGHPMQIKKIAAELFKAKHPVICAGGGVISAGASEVLHDFAKKHNIPVLTTMMGKGAIPCGDPLNFGMIGSHGVYTANFALNNCDLLILLGARVGDRAMGTAAKLSKKATIIHIDVDPAEIGKNMEAHIPVVGDVKNVLTDLITRTEEITFDEWTNELSELRKKHQKHYEEYIKFVNPRYVLKLLTEKIDTNAVVTTEVGQNQIWCANSFMTNGPRNFISSGGMGTMGYGLPAAVGASFAEGIDYVVAIEGDGSFQMSMQELGTIIQEDLNVKMVIFNNNRLGMVREIQKLKNNGRYNQVFLNHNPDFIKLGEAYGIKGEVVKTDKEVEAAIDRMLNHKGAYIMECKVDPEESTL